MLERGQLEKVTYQESSLNATLRNHSGTTSTHIFKTMGETRQFPYQRKPEIH